MLSKNLNNILSVLNLYFIVIISQLNGYLKRKLEMGPMSLDFTDTHFGLGVVYRRGTDNKNVDFCQEFPYIRKSNQSLVSNK